MNWLLRRGALISLTAVTLLLGLPAIVALASDHLDGPLASSDGRLDITDLYAFKHGDNTVLIMAVNPLAGVLSLTTFHPDASYDIKIDNTGDAKEDLTYSLTFSEPDGSGAQDVLLRLVPPGSGARGAVLARGKTGQTIPVRGGGWLRAGLFDDPFFFDLLAFRGSILGQGTRRFCDAGTSDFFLGLNVSAIVLEVPSASLVGGSSRIGVWARTELAGQQVDRVGRPLISTLFMRTGAEKDAFNAGIPSHDQRDFRSDVVDTIVALTGDTAYANAIADILLPDILSFDTASSAGFLNGRRLADDVVDILLSVVTKGAVTTDCIANDSVFSNTFPYLAAPN